MTAFRRTHLFLALSHLTIDHAQKKNKRSKAQEKKKKTFSVTSVQKSHPTLLTVFFLFILTVLGELCLPFSDFVVRRSNGVACSSRTNKAAEARVLPDLRRARSNTVRTTRRNVTPHLGCVLRLMLVRFLLLRIFRFDLHFSPNRTSFYARKNRGVGRAIFGMSSPTLRKAPSSKTRFSTGAVRIASD